MLHSNAFNNTWDRTKRLTGLKKNKGPINYLGFRLFFCRPRNISFTYLVKKIVCRITGWQTKKLICGGKPFLTKHLLQEVPIIFLFAVTPPTTILKQIQGLIDYFFWGRENDRKKYDKASWKNLSYPYDEGGMGDEKHTRYLQIFPIQTVVDL